MTKSTRGKTGFTLVELTIAIAILAVVMTAVSGIFLSMGNLWSRTDYQHQTQTTISEAANRLTTDLRSGCGYMIRTRFTSSDTIIITMPQYKVGTYYTPDITNNKLYYSPGELKAYYLSDSSGSFSVNGDILWSGKATFDGSVYTVVPNTAICLWPSTSVGQVQPISSLKFENVSTESDYSIRVTIVTPVKEQGVAATDNVIFKVHMRNHP